MPSLCYYMAIDDQRGVAPMASSDHLSTLHAHTVQCAHHPGDHELRMDRRGRRKILTEGERGAITTARLAYSTHTPHTHTPCTGSLHCIETRDDEARLRQRGAIRIIRTSHTQDCRRPPGRQIALLYTPRLVCVVYTHMTTCSTSVLRSTSGSTTTPHALCVIAIS